MIVDGGAADQPLHHLPIEPERASFLQAETAAGLRAHRTQHFLLRAQIVLRRDLGIADADQSLPAVTPENVGDSPYRKADHQHAHEDHAKRPASPFAQSVECHALTFHSCLPKPR